MTKIPGKVRIDRIFTGSIKVNQEMTKNPDKTRNDHILAGFI